MLEESLPHLRVVKNVSMDSVNDEVLRMLGRGDICRVRVRVLNHGSPRGPSLPTGEEMRVRDAGTWAFTALHLRKHLLLDPDTCDSGAWLEKVWKKVCAWEAMECVGCAASTRGVGPAWGAKFVCGRRGAMVVYGTGASSSSRARAAHLCHFSEADETFAMMAASVKAGPRAGAVMHITGCEGWLVREWLPQGAGDVVLPVLYVDDYVSAILDGDDSLVGRCGVLRAGLGLCPLSRACGDREAMGGGKVRATGSAV
jgi:hypothetical protein